MKTLTPISVDTAGELIDFAGSRSGFAAMAESQLRGAAAIHNILARERFAYLADEVGMGKTYVALGVAALMRYFHPDLRVLYIAPRENIQRKWRKELGNFTSNNWRWTDQRVRTVQDTPVDRGVFCHGLLDWARHAVRDPNRDVFVRLTSFSFPLPDHKKGRKAWKKKRTELLQLAPFLTRNDIPLQHSDKDLFKEDYATAVNRLLPHYDLVVIDEAHNLKHGRDGSSTRNRLIARVLGAHGRDVERKFDRVLFLSATPLESDFAELWRQFDLLGFGEEAAQLSDKQIEEAPKRETASRFVVRRLTKLSVAGETHTKNMYRREWRAGGMELHDDQLAIPSARQRLIVALVQKKVAEVLQDERFGARFQIGMLASFESFLQTAKVARSDDDDPLFDHANQTDDDLERDGIDSAALGRLADSYRRKFHEPLPHPKMDAVVASLADTFATGDKTLVFVRRVKSVPELADKLAREYDASLRKRLLAELDQELHEDLEAAWTMYDEDRNTRRRTTAEPVEDDEHPEDAEEALMVDDVGIDDAGGTDTFFAWFFRGEGPPGFLSGAAFQKNRLRGEGSVYSTFFEENYVWDLLGSPDDVLESLARVLSRPVDEVDRDLRAMAYSRVTQVERQRQPRLRIFRAYQEAGLRLLAQSSTAIADRAALVLRLRYLDKPVELKGEAPASFSSAQHHLGTRTFFTELRKRPALRNAIWPSPTTEDFGAYFREREVRRELVSAVVRLGHSFIDLWALAVQRIGSIRLGARDEGSEQSEDLITDFLDRLDAQQATEGFHAFRELSAVGGHHGLIMAVNFPEAKQQPLPELARTFGRALSTQTPIGGMHGGVNSRLVRQFRMPGYPIALITTDVLQEGEDLHTFCSRIVHYGISWTPSAMEQRTGRIDRIGSLVHRRLEALNRQAHPGELLQVHYPYLADTVEKLQVDRVFRRMNEFMRLTHRGGGMPDEDSRIDTRAGFLQAGDDLAPLDTPLESAFPVLEGHLAAPSISLGKPDQAVETALRRFDAMTAALGERVQVVWDAYESNGERYGTVYVKGKDLVAVEAGELALQKGVRQQPVALRLRTSVSGLILVHGMSPAGIVFGDEARTMELVRFQSELKTGVRVCESPAGARDEWLITVEDDILLHPEGTSVEELEDLVQRIAVTADQLEQYLFEDVDASLDEYRANLHREARRGQHSEPPRR